MQPDLNSPAHFTRHTRSEKRGLTWQVSLTGALRELWVRSIHFYFFFLLKIDTIKDGVQQESQNRSTDIRQRSSPVRSEDQSLAYVVVGGLRGSQHLSGDKVTHTQTEPIKHVALSAGDRETAVCAKTS